MNLQRYFISFILAGFSLTPFGYAIEGVKWVNQQVLSVTRENFKGVVRLSVFPSLYWPPLASTPGSSNSQIVLWHNTSCLVLLFSFPVPNKLRDPAGRWGFQGTQKPVKFGLQGKCWARNHYCLEILEQGRQILLGNGTLNWVWSNRGAVYPFPPHNLT